MIKNDYLGMPFYRTTLKEDQIENQIKAHRLDLQYPALIT